MTKEKTEAYAGKLSITEGGFMTAAIEIIMPIFVAAPLPIAHSVPRETVGQ